MNFLTLVTYFRKGGTFEEFCSEQSLNIDSEVIGIYSTKPFSLDTELKFFEAEVAGMTIEFVYKGICYFELLDFHYFLEAIEDSLEENAEQLTDYEIAQSLFNYAILDS